MKFVTLILDVLIYICGAVVVFVGGYVVLRYFKGEAKKHRKR